MKKLILIILPIFLLACKKEAIEGCTNSLAINYNSSAEVDNGSCTYNTYKIKGCTDPLAINYNSSAEIDNGNCFYSEPTSVYIYAVVATPTTDESVTIKNNTGSSVDLSSWTIGDLNSPNAYSIPSGFILSNGQMHKFPRTTLGFQVNDSGETIYLKDVSGITIDTWYN